MYQYLHHNQWWGSVAFWYGSGCGSGFSDQYLWLMGSGSESGRPEQIRILRLGNRMRIRNTGTFTSFFKDKSHKEVKNNRNQGFSCFFAWWWMDPDPDPDPYLWLTDPNADPGGPKAYVSYGSESPTVIITINIQENPVLRSSILYINDVSRDNGENPHSVDADTELCWCWIRTRIRIQAFEDQDLIKIQGNILTMRKLATPSKHA